MAFSPFKHPFSALFRDFSQPGQAEVKYFLKIVTPGSKEEKQLAKVQRAFEQAYKANSQALGNADGGAQWSIGEIVDNNGTSYGIGVHLDSDLLTGLDDAERKQMVKLYVIDELAGATMLAYDGDTPVEISFAQKNEKIKTQSGNKMPVLKELYHKNINNDVKQETVILADELIATSKHESSAPARHVHDWLDNNGKNQWDRRTVYIQEQSKTVWEATLQIANSTDGRKILYDIDPIKRVAGETNSSPTATVAEGARKSAPTTAKSSISPDVPGVKQEFSIGGAQYTIGEGEAVVELSEDNELKSRIGETRGAGKFKIIQSYILEVLENQPIVFSDGLEAIVDRSDALHIANKSASKKTAEISKIQEIIENARPVAEATNVEHRKFESFRYYEAFAKYGEETFPIYLNVGRGRNDGLYHLYDITQKSEIPPTE